MFSVVRPRGSSSFSLGYCDFVRTARGISHFSPMHQPNRSVPRFVSAAIVLLLFATIVKAQLPGGWSSTDIGSPGLAGSSSYAAGTWTVRGSGADIWGTSDQFQFAYNNAVTNYSVIVARVTAQDNTHAWAKAGVMFRDSTAADSMFAMAVATPGNGVSFQWRTSHRWQCGYSGVEGHLRAGLGQGGSIREWTFPAITARMEPPGRPLARLRLLPCATTHRSAWL